MKQRVSDERLAAASGLIAATRVRGVIPDVVVRFLRDELRSDLDRLGAGNRTRRARHMRENKGPIVDGVTVLIGTSTYRQEGDVWWVTDARLPGWTAVAHSQEWAASLLREALVVMPLMAELDAVRAKLSDAEASYSDVAATLVQSEAALADARAELVRLSGVTHFDASAEEVARLRARLAEVEPVMRAAVAVGAYPPLRAAVDALPESTRKEYE